MLHDSGPRALAMEMNLECHLLPPPLLPAHGADAWEIIRPCKERGERRRRVKGKPQGADIN